MCRQGSLKLPGFPEFESVVTDLKKNNTDIPPPEFTVCIPVPNGLAIRQNLIDHWMDNDQFQVEMADVLKEHNEKYNPHGVKRGGETQESGPRNQLSFTQFNIMKKIIYYILLLQ